MRTIDDAKHEVVPIAAGLELVVTGALGHCPLYQARLHTDVTTEVVMNIESIPNQPLNGADGPKRAGHGWMMMICCIPMIAIVIALVAAGVASPGFLVAAAACTVMMAMMMRTMDHSHGHDHR